MYVLFSVRRNPNNSSKIADGPETTKDVRQIRVSVDYGDGEPMYEVVFRRYEASTHKANVGTILKMASHLQHFFDYYMVIREKEKVMEEVVIRDQDILLDLVADLEKKFSDKNVDDTVYKRQKEDPSLNYRDIELGLYQELLDEVYLDNDRLMELIIRYNQRILLDEMIPDPNVENRLTSADCFIIHCLVLYSRLMYLPYFKIKANVSYIEICRGTLIRLGNTLNDKIREMGLFIPEETEESFISRLYAFLLNACAYDFERNKKNLQRYAVAGMSKESTAMRSVLDQIITTFSRTALMVKFVVNPIDKERQYDNIEEFDLFGMVSKNTVGYIQRAKKEVVANELGNIKPSYILSILSSDDGDGTEMSTTSRYELQAEKTDKEHYIRMMDNAENIMDDIYVKIARNKDEVKKIYENIKKTSINTFRTDLNKMMVSFLFLSKHGTDISGVITLEQYVQACIYLYERLSIRYPDLASSIMASSRARLNGIDITEDDFRDELKSVDKSFLIHDRERVLHQLTKVSSCDYVIVTIEGRISRVYNIKDDLIQWIKDGMHI